MIKQIIFLGLMLVSALGFGQANFAKIDEKSKETPNNLADYKAIANYLTNDLHNDAEKARAIYIWITHNIHYDMAQINSNKRYASSLEFIDEVLVNRKGVCQHYAELFRAMAQSVGIKSYLISGYTKDAEGKIASLSHAWNAIEIDAKFYLIDATWAAGHELNGKYVHKFRDEYFMKSPHEFMKTHMPFDPIWQFSNNPINNKEFVANDFSNLSKKGNFAYSDSIRLYEKQKPLEKLEKTNKRIMAGGINNNLIQRQVNENILQITNLKYNNAIDTLNDGIKNYNFYITYKNRQFRNPKLTDTALKELIDKSSQGIYAANEMLYGLLSANSELNNLILEARNNMPKIISDLETEKDFVEKYLKKWKPLRIFMFATHGSTANR